MKLSIIVPVYNVEQYIGPCLESIFRQGLYEDDYEVIVVNDGTTDRSMEVVESVKSTHHNIYIIEQQNQGLSAARNTGMDQATGDYILFLDSDDLFIENTLPTLLQAATDNKADMVMADFVKMDNEAIAKRSLSVTDSSHSQQNQKSGTASPELKVMRGVDAFLGEFDPHECYVWRSLYRRSFLCDNNLRFVQGIYFEDVPFTPACHIRSAVTVRLRCTFYIYRQRPNSIVSSVNMKKFTDFNTAIAHLWQMKTDLCTTPELRQRMDDTIFVTFSICVWCLSTDKAMVDNRHTFIADLRRKIPDLRFYGGLKPRLVSAIFRCMPSTYLWLRYRLNIK